MRRSIPEKPSSVEDILETGVLDNWYLVARDTDVDTGPVALKRLNRDIVLWRDESGQLNAVEDFCPHRGARLSIGRVSDGMITCAYHGLRLNGEGVIMATPPTPNSPFVGQKAIKSYPCREANGAIWVYFSDNLEGEPPELRFPDEFNSGEWCGFVDIRVFECNYQLVRDNQLDPMHGSYLHMGTHALSGGKTDGELGYRKTKNGFVVWRKNQQGVNLDRSWVNHYPGSGFWASSEFPFPANEGGGMVRLFRYPTLIDREHTLVYNYRLQKRTGWKRDMWRFLYKNRAHARGEIVMEQDRVALATIPVDAGEREMLLQCDVGVARVRRMYREEAERQFNAMNEVKSAAE